uniref:Uncharacterized protein n=1 Tax=Clastoptera arizonana TaxID=38151 RepID=A0A1B6DE04_9HEMI
MEFVNNNPETVVDKGGRRMWKPGHKYGGPCLCKCKLRYIQPEIPASFKPIKSFRAPNIAMPDGTTYKMSYEAMDPQKMKHCRGTQIRPSGNLTCAGDFSSNTTNSMSYGAWPGYKRPPPHHPKDHKLMGDGPISSLTTNKHDYTPKPIEAVDKIIQPGNLGFSTKPLDDKTTNYMSYQCPDYSRFEPAQSFKPRKSYLPPNSKMENDTVNKMSYRPFAPIPKEIYPWALKDKYRKPCVPFEGSTIYDYSFAAPGRFEESCIGPDGCYCKYPGECFDSYGNPPKAHQYDVCPAGYDPATDPPRSPPVTSND